MKSKNRKFMITPLNPARPSRRKRFAALFFAACYFEPAVKLIYAIGAVVGLIGAVKVYGKFSSGDPDTAKTCASWMGACVFLIVCATVLKSFFGTTY